jgi:hypothetical protein
MAFLAIILPLDQPQLRNQAQGQIRQEGLGRELGVINPQGLAFRAANGVAESVRCGIPVPQQVFSSLCLRGGDFEADSRRPFGREPKPGQSKFIVNFRPDSGFHEAPPD